MEARLKIKMLCKSHKIRA